MYPMLDVIQVHVLLFSLFIAYFCSPVFSMPKLSTAQDIDLRGESLKQLKSNNKSLRGTRTNSSRRATGNITPRSCRLWSIRGETNAERNYDWMSQLLK